MQTRTNPWEKIGTSVDGCVTAEEAIKTAGLDTPVSLRSISTVGKNDVDGIKVIDKICDFKQAVVRETDGRILGVVGNNYEPIQNRECFDFLDSIVGEGQAVYHSAGSIDDGRMIFITLKFPNNHIVGDPQKGDEIGNYINLTTSHDGTSSIRLNNMAIRLVCTNGLTTTRSVGEIKIRHSKQYKEKIAMARAVLGLSEQYAQWFNEQCDKMFNAEFDDNQMKRFVEKLIPGKKNENGDVIVSSRKQNIRDDIRHLFTSGQGQAEVTGTRWAAYNAVTEYADHVRSTNVRNGRNENEVKFISSMIGSGALLKNRAFDMLAVQ